MSNSFGSASFICMSVPCLTVSLFLCLSICLSVTDWLSVFLSVFLLTCEQAHVWVVRARARVSGEVARKVTFRTSSPDSFAFEMAFCRSRVCSQCKPARRLSFFLSVCLFVTDCLSFCLCLSFFLSFCLSVCLTDCLSVCLSDCVSVCLSHWLTVYAHLCFFNSVRAVSVFGMWKWGCRRAAETYFI